MMNRLPHLAQRMFNVPVAIAPAKAEVIIAALADRLGIAHMFRANGEPSRSRQWHSTMTAKCFQHRDPTAAIRDMISSKAWR